jgi:hypothetical protein
MKTRDNAATVRISGPCLGKLNDIHATRAGRNGMQTVGTGVGTRHLERRKANKINTLQGCVAEGMGLGSNVF